MYIYSPGKLICCLEMHYLLQERILHTNRENCNNCVQQSNCRRGIRIDFSAYSIRLTFFAPFSSTSILLLFFSTTYVHVLYMYPPFHSDLPFFASRPPQLHGPSFLPIPTSFFCFLYKKNLFSILIFLSFPKNLLPYPK